MSRRPSGQVVEKATNVASARKVHIGKRAGTPAKTVRKTDLAIRRGNARRAETAHVDDRLHVARVHHPGRATSSAPRPLCYGGSATQTHIEFSSPAKDCGTALENTFCLRAMNYCISSLNNCCCQTLWSGCLREPADPTGERIPVTNAIANPVAT